MPRYYFDVRDGQGFHRDEFGDEFGSFDAARHQAQSLLPHIAREEMPDSDQHCITCEVRDDTGRVVYRGELTFEGRWLQSIVRPPGRLTTD